MNQDPTQFLYQINTPDLPSRYICGHSILKNISNNICNLTKLLSTYLLTYLLHGAKSFLRS